MYPSDTSNKQEIELDDGTAVIGLGNVATTIEEDD